MISKLVLFFFIYLAITNGQVPAQGAYAVLRSDAINQWVDQLSLMVAYNINTDTTTPPINGENKKAKYTLSDFRYNTYLGNVSVSSSAANHLTVTWSTFRFFFYANYHVCARIIFHPCEKGYVEVWATEATDLSIDLALDLTGPTVKATVASVALNWPKDSVKLKVHCKSTICIIPTHDIADALAEEFAPTMQQIITKGVDTLAASYINTISTVLSIPEYNAKIYMNGGFNVINSNLIVYGQGSVEIANSPMPPFSPSFVPPMNLFANPNFQVEFILTNYLPHSLMWALQDVNMLNAEITNSDLPANSPIHLLTSDSFFQQAVPGLTNFPNMEIVMSLSVSKVIDVKIESQQGVSWENLMTIGFTLTNKTLTFPAFALTVDFDLLTQVKLQVENDVINYQPVVFNSTNVVQVETSKVGPVNAEMFSQVIALGVTQVPTLPSFNLKPPPGFDISQAAIDMQDGYALTSANMKFSQNVPNVPCQSITCAIDNICCGNYCCTAPLKCCNGGCCE